MWCCLWLPERKTFCLSEIAGAEVKKKKSSKRKYFHINASSLEEYHCDIQLHSLQDFFWKDVSQNITTGIEAFKKPKKISLASVFRFIS